MVEVTEALARNVGEVWGDDGRRWLGRLPAMVDAVAREWSLEIGPAYVLSFHWVARVRLADGSDAVVKLGLPHAPHLRREAATLECFDGHGAVRLLAHDPGLGALLLERAVPGSMARELVPRNDIEATDAAIGVLRRLHSAAWPADGLPELHTERQAFVDHLAAYPGDDPLPRDLVVAGLRTFDDLCASATRRVVLHGDLHHDNILRSDREGWLAIDPHGWVGDPGFEVGPLLYNPDPERHDDGLLALVPRRVEQLADGLGLPVDRVAAWGFAAAVLSEVWSAEDGGRAGHRPLCVARLLAPRLP